MIKEVFIIHGTGQEEFSSFKQRLFKIASHYKENQSTSEVRLVITETNPPVISIIPFQRIKMAVLSVYYPENIDVPIASEMEGLAGHYFVEEALVLSYEKTWADADKTPGTCLLTLFRKKKTIDYQTFIDRWHYGHSPLSLKIHPLWHYNRNVVKEELAGSQTWYDGLVEEHVKKKSDLLNPFKFFGNPLIIIPRMVTVYRDVKSFIDYGSIESYLTQEYILKSTTNKYAPH